MKLNKVIKKETEFAGKKFTLEAGKFAILSNMAVKATYGDTVMLVTTVAGSLNPEIDFFPLTVNYVEKLFASGSIKSSRFQKRDFRSSDDMLIIGRAADHAIRPLFPQDFRDETQVIGTVLSIDKEGDPQVLFMNAVSACLTASDIPWAGPMVSAKVGYINGEYVLNPSHDQLHKESDLNLIVSFVGDNMDFLAIEAEANILPEEKILGAIDFARNNLKGMLAFIKEFAKEINPNAEKFEYESQKLDADLVNEVKLIAQDKVAALMAAGLNKDEMKPKMAEIWDSVWAKLEGKYKKVKITEAFMDIERHALQHLILDEGRRPDGRGIKDVRDISCEVSILPRTHGSAYFARGITQMLSIVTLGSPTMELINQDLYGEHTQRYMHFYNFPPYSSGETGRFGGYPKNREIGHGRLAENAIKPVLPNKDLFPYTVIVNSETLSSSGSTSMAATCGSTLALMDAGVPIKAMVAGVGVGLIVNDDMSKQLIMTDLAYKEDAYGFLDFKMTGTRDGVTAIQCDMKANGIPMDLIPKIFEQSKEGRMHVLDVMEKVISKPKPTVSNYAPKMVVTKIDPSSIGIVIGAGGKVIKGIQEKTGAEISIEEDGTVVATSINESAAVEAIQIIENLLKDIEVGEIYDGTVVEVLDFGALVEILPGKVGLAHISELSNEFVDNVNDVVAIGDTMQVKVLDVDRRSGKISLSKKALEPGYQENTSRGGGGRDRGFDRGRDSRGGNDRNDRGGNGRRGNDFRGNRR